MNAFLESATGLSLLHPWMLLLVVLVPAALLLRRGRARAIDFAPAAFLAAETPAADAPHAPLPVSLRVRLLGLPLALHALALVLVVFALARPVERAPLPLRAEGIDILLCLDVSSSMTAQDLERGRTRLEVSKDAAAEFVRARRDDRIGLVTFARYPDLRCPPTLDHAALAAILAGVTTVESDGPEDATGIGTAVARAAAVLEGSAAKSRVVILLTDGEENVATPKAPGEIAPAHAAQLCLELGVRVYAVVAGAGAATAPPGRPAIDTRPVARLAARTGGEFFEARDAGAVAGVYAYIDALEKAAVAEPRYAVVERFLPFLAAALGAMLLAALLGTTVLGVLP